MNESRYVEYDGVKCVSTSGNTYQNHDLKPTLRLIVRVQVHFPKGERDNTHSTATLVFCKPKEQALKP